MSSRFSQKKTATKKTESKIKYFSAAFIIAIGVFFVHKAHEYYLAHYTVPYIMDSEFYLNENVFYKKHAIASFMQGAHKKPPECLEETQVTRMSPIIEEELTFQQRRLHPKTGRWIEIIHHQACGFEWLHQVEFTAADTRAPLITILTSEQTEEEELD